MTSPVQMNRLLRRRRWARWGLLLTTLALAAALLGSAWAGYRSAEDAVGGLERAQAGTLAAAFRGGAFGAWERARARGSDRAQADPLPRGVDSAGEGVVPDSTSGRVIRRGGLTDEEISATIDSIVADRSEAGLRWAGFVSSEGTVLAGGGDAMDEPFRVSSSQGGPTLTHLGQRVRAYFGRPGDPRRSPVTLVVEFEPVIARAMVSSARRSLFLATVVSGLLTLAGLMFWRLSVRFEAAERRLEEQRRLSVLGEMSAVLAHEIRNPLASLKGHAQLLVERLAGASDERKKAERVVTEATRLEALTSDLLDFAGSGPLRIEDLDPVELIQASAAEAAPDVEVSVRSSGAPAHWPLDGRRLRQSLVNLIRNAAQASPPGEPPEVDVTEEANRLVVVVRDHGEGLPQGNEDRIFDPFFTTRTTGTGLGLPVARRIVELHGGALTASNAPNGGGAMFRIEIPRRN